MSKGFFITGTDTGIGKTTVTLALLRALKQQGYTVAGMKPVSAGCRKTPQGLRNDDAEQLQRESSIEIPYDTINPFAYDPPIAPHIAAAQSGRPIDIAQVTAAYQRIAAQVDVVLVEGAGGWAVPINDWLSMADVAKALNLPVVLVSGIRLGCLNHTLLTHAAIEASGCACAGWIANHLCPPDSVTESNVRYLRQALPIAYLGAIAFAGSPQIPTTDIKLPDL